MSANTGFKFLGYELRPATAEDLELARAWVDADPAHRGKMAPGFWIEQEAGVDSYLLLDAEGPLFFFRMQRVVRLLIQFSPTAERSRTRKGLTEGMRWLQAALAAKGVGEILFDSASTLLRTMVIGRLGFTTRPDTLSKIVYPPIRRPLQPIFIPAMDYAMYDPTGTLPATLKPEDANV